MRESGREGGLDFGGGSSAVTTRTCRTPPRPNTKTSPGC